MDNQLAGLYLFIVSNIFLFVCAETSPHMFKSSSSSLLFVPFMLHQLQNVTSEALKY